MKALFINNIHASMHKNVYRDTHTHTHTHTHARTHTHTHIHTHTNTHTCIHREYSAIVYVQKIIYASTCKLCTIFSIMLHRAWHTIYTAYFNQYSNKFTRRHACRKEYYNEKGVQLLKFATYFSSTKYLKRQRCTVKMLRYI